MVSATNFQSRGHVHLQELVFLVWLSEKLALEAAAEHESLQLRQGQTVQIHGSATGLDQAWESATTLVRRTLAKDLPESMLQVGTLS